MSGVGCAAPLNIQCLFVRQLNLVRDSAVKLFHNQNQSVLDALTQSVNVKMILLVKPVEDC